MKSLELNSDEWGFKVDMQTGKQELIIPKKEAFTRDNFNNVLGAANNLQEMLLDVIQRTDLGLEK